MKVLKYICALLFVSSLTISACKKDNYDAPSSKLTGRVLFEGKPVGLRTNRVQLELWQHGYDFFAKVPVYVSQDGTFSALIFDGNYKLTILRGIGPWPDKTDSVDVTVKGNTVVDINVAPYYVVTGATYQKSGNTINGSINIKKGTSNGALESVSLYINKSVLIDNTYKIGDGTVIPAANIPNVNQAISASITIPAELANEQYVYVRAGVKTVGVEELAYSEPFKIALK